MPKICYTPYNPKPETRRIIELANEILEEYTAQGFNLTLRQLYYQFISRDLFPDSYVSGAGTKNNVKSYNKLGAIISAAREGGMIDWSYIKDRGRSSESRPHWEGPEQFMSSVAPQFNTDLWADQPRRVEVWVEKDALSDVVGRACEPLDVPYTACKGYMSASTMWEAAQRMLRNFNTYSQPTVILHLGDHDPSGIDMTRDIKDRLNLFSAQYQERFRGRGHDITVTRIALTRGQITEYAPPPNPAKETDSRFASYQEIHGDESWELDALEPQVLVDLITEHIRNLLAPRAFSHSQLIEATYRDSLVWVGDNWDRVDHMRQSENDDTAE